MHIRVLARLGLTVAAASLLAPGAIAQPAATPHSEDKAVRPASASKVLATSELPLPVLDKYGRATFDFVAEAVRDAAGADVAVVDLSRAQGSLALGRIDAASLRAVMPWNPQLVRYALTGAELQTLLLDPSLADKTVVRSGFAEPRSSKPPRLRVGGRAIEPSRRYSVVLLSDWVDRVDRVHAVSLTAETLSITLHDSLARYLLTHPFLRATPAGRVIASELPASVQCRDQLQVPAR